MKKRLQQTVLGLTLLFSAVAPTGAYAASQSTAPVTIGEKVIASGYKYLGAPYLYGADPSRTDRFDCSSFTFRAFIEHGINLPRTSNAQMGLGVDVSMEQAVPGDLVFFRDTANPDIAGHVGIYLGSGRMLHASTSKGVSTVDITTGYWKQRFMAVKRIIPATYTVQSGDSLWKISLANQITVQELRSWNKLGTDELLPGNQLMVENPDLLMSKVFAKGNSYVVQPGDTLWNISQRTGIELAHIQQWNDLSHDAIMAGQRLKLEAPYNTHIVAAGESLWSISQKTRTPQAAIKSANDLNSDMLYVGQVLRIPVSY